jgi:Transposase DDE domain group 1
MENRIKEQQLDLFADRTSTETMKANQLRLWFASMAYVLLNRVREVALAGTELAHATVGTIRLKLLKILGKAQRAPRAHRDGLRLFAPSSICPRLRRDRPTRRQSLIHSRFAPA